MFRSEITNCFCAAVSISLFTLLSSTTGVANPPAMKAGAELVVQGPAKGDKLNLRATASATSAAVAQISPKATGLVATGRTSTNGADKWIEVRFQSKTGWVNSRFVRVAGAKKELPKSDAVQQDGPNPAAKSETNTATPAELKPGTRLIVQGASKGDKLNLRREASASSSILIELPPDAAGLKATGQSKKNDSDTWFEVRFRNHVGWVHSRFIRPSTVSSTITQPAKTQLNHGPNEKAQIDLIKSNDPFADCDSTEASRRLSGCTALIARTETAEAVRAIAYSRRSDTRMERQEFDQAIEDRHSALKLEPTDEQHKARLSAAYHLRGLTQTQNKSYDRAIADYTESVKYDTKNHAAFEARGLTFAHQGDLDKAIADLTLASQLDTTNERYILDLAGFYERRGSDHLLRNEFDLAVAQYNTAIRLSDKNASLYMLRADAYWGARDVARTLWDVDKALELEPGNIRALFRRAEVRLAGSQYDSAVDDFTRIIKTEPKNVEAVLYRAIAFEQSNRFEAAIDDYRLAVKIQPKNQVAKKHLERLVAFEKWRKTKK